MNEPDNRRSALLVTTLSSFLNPFMGSSINIALPAIGKEFAMNAFVLSWVAASFLLASAMFLVPCGRIADIFGRKKIFIYGIVCYTASSFLAAFSFSAATLIFMRVIQGISGAMVFSTALAILISVFPVEERGKVIGINTASVYIGLSLGPPLGGFLTEQFGWRSIFLANVPPGLIVIYVAFFMLKGEWAEARGEKFDLIGSVLYSVALIALMAGVSLLPSINGLWLIALGVLGIGAFAGWEMKVEDPVFDVNLFRKNTLFAFSNLAALLNHSATFAVTFLLSLYLQYVKGFSPWYAGAILVSQPIVMAIFSPLSGRLSDRIEPRIVASAGMALTVVGLVLFSLFDMDTSVSFILASLVVSGFGFAFFSSPNTNAVMSSIEKKYYGVASATLGTMRLTGQIFSMGVVMVMFAIYMGKVQIAPENHVLFLKSAETAFEVFALLCFGGIFASLARSRVRQ